MPVQLVGFSYGPFILLAIPSFCFYEPQTPITTQGSAEARGAHERDDPDQERERHGLHDDAWQQFAERDAVGFRYCAGVPAPVVPGRLRDAGGDECAMVVSFPLYLSSAPMGRSRFLVLHPC